MSDFELDDRRRAILAAHGHLLIEGGPGCGKTTIALLKARKSAEALKAEQRVLFLSFSRAAVRQVTDRTRTTLSAAEGAVLDIRTFHSFFLGLIRSHGRILTGGPMRFFTPEREAQRRADFAGDAGAWADEVRRLAAEDSIYVFDTLAPAAAELLEGSKSLRALYSDRYPLLIVDEFQDTNFGQWRAVRAFSERSMVICLADPDQRIFDHIEGVDEQRLADVKTTLNPHTFDLSSDNHRSPASGILEYANGVLRNLPTIAPDDVHTYTYQYESPELFTHALTKAAMDYLQSKLGTSPTLAILTRVNTFAGRISESLSVEEWRKGSKLPPLDHTLFWDPELAAASALVVASVLEWPTMTSEAALLGTLHSIADYCRVKVGLGTAGARDTVTTIERAIAAIQTGTIIRAKTAKLLADAVENAPYLTGRAVDDWQLARSVLRGSVELNEISTKARLIRLLNATDALAWSLAGTWNGISGYSGAVEAVRTALASEAVNVQQVDDSPIHVMTMHKSKGKEYDGVIIVEARYGLPLLDPDPGSKQQDADRRLLRVAITRARHLVVLLRPFNAAPLTSSP